MASIFGTPGNDSIRTAAAGGSTNGVADATDDGDVIIADAGDDRIEAGIGSDVIQPGPGSDAVFAGDGNDLILVIYADGTVPTYLAPSDVAFGEVVDGGDGNEDMLFLSGIGAVAPLYDLTSWEISDIEVLEIDTATTTVRLTAAQLAGFDGLIGPGATLELFGPFGGPGSFSLFGKLLGPATPFTRIVLASPDPDVLVLDHVGSDVIAVAGGANDVVYLPGTAGDYLPFTPGDPSVAVFAADGTPLYDIQGGGDIRFGTGPGTGPGPGIARDDALRGTIGGRDTVNVSVLAANDDGGVTFTGLVGATALSATEFLLVTRDAVTGDVDGIIDFNSATGDILYRGLDDAFSFAYEAVDAEGTVRTATVTVTVNNTQPQPVDLTFVLQPGLARSFQWADIIAVNTDPDGDPLTLAAYGPTNPAFPFTFVDPAWGSFSANIDEFTIMPNAGASGAQSFFYILADRPDLGGATRTAFDANRGTLTFTIPSGPPPPPPPVFTLRLAENVMPEGTGAGNGGFIAFTVQRDLASNLAAATVVVSVAPTGANPIDADDLFSAFSGIVVNFAAGQEFAEFSLAISPDTLFENDETLSVSLASTTLGTVDATPITAVIFNDDLPPPAFTLTLIENVELEGTPPGPGGNMVFRIDRASGAPDAATITYRVGAAPFLPATPDDVLGGFGDFTITIGEGQASALLSITATPDRIFENDGVISVFLLSSSVGTVDTTPALAVIINDDLPPPEFVLRLNENIEREGSPPFGGGSIGFRIERVFGAADAATLTVSVGAGPVNLATADDVAGGFRTFTVTLGEGENVAFFPLFATPDTLFENDESISVALVSSTFGTVDTTPVTAVIINDDLPPPAFVLTVIDNREIEGGSITFEITRVSGASDAAVITYAVGPGPVNPALADDLVGGFGTATIAIGAGENSVRFSLMSTPDTLFENDETIAVSLVSASVGTVNTTPVTAVIFNDDAPENRAPVAANDSFTTRPGQVLGIAAPGLLANDSDPDGDAILATQFTQGAQGGVVTLVTDGSFTYTPNPGFVGQDSFTYSVFDGVLFSEFATVTIEVVNAAPVAVADSFTVQEGRTLTIAGPGLLANDTDADGDALIASNFSGAANGQVSLVTDGSFTYTPNPGFSGIDSFTYSVFDGVAFSGFATVTIDVVEGTPIAVADSFTMRPGQVLRIDAPGLLANDVDPNGDALIASNFSGAANGQVSLVTDGSFTYTPNPGFSGVDSFTYSVFDGVLFSEFATVTIEVANAAPVAVDDSFTVQAGQVLTIAAPGVLANDTDADGDRLSVELITDPVDNGRLSLFPDGNFTYTPTPGFSGVDSFRYRISDGFGGIAEAVATINVVGGNAAPTDIALTNAAVLENLPAGTLIGLLSATDPDDSETVAFSFAPGGNAGGLFRLDGNRLLTNAVLDHEAAATRGITLRVTDSAGNTHDEAFSIAVGDVAEGGPSDPVAPVTINGPGFTVSNGNAGTPATATPAGPPVGTGTLSPLVDTAPITLPGETTPRARIENEGTWDGFKNLVLGPSFWTPAFGTDVLLANFVDVRWDLASAPALDFDLLVVGGKRGAVTLAGGDDALTWVFHSNEGVWNNTATIAGGAGDDTLAFTTVGLSTVDDALLADNADPSNGRDWNAAYDGRFSTAVADGGAGNDMITAAARVRLVADGGAGDDVIIGGARNDSLRGGDGNDRLTGGQGPDRFLFDADDGTDVITDFTRWQGDRVVLEGPGAFAFSGNGFTFGATTVTATNGHIWSAADFLFA